MAQLVLLITFKRITFNIIIANLVRKQGTKKKIGKLKKSPSGNIFWIFGTYTGSLRHMVKNQTWTKREDKQANGNSSSGTGQVR